MLGYALVAVIAAAVAVFALQNSAPTSIRFLVWRMDDLPVAAVVLGALAAGIALAGVPLALLRWSARARVRTLEARVRDLEARLAPPPLPRRAAEGEPGRAPGAGAAEV